MVKYAFDLSRHYADKLNAFVEKSGKFKSEVLRQIVIAFLDDTKAVVIPKEEPVKFSGWICVRDLPQHSNPAMQTNQCNACKINHWTDWKACQELKAEQKK